jgi:hypothetical protein
MTRWQRSANSSAHILKQCQVLLYLIHFQRLFFKCLGMVQLISPGQERPFWRPHDVQACLIGMFGVPIAANQCPVKKPTFRANCKALFLGLPTSYCGCFSWNNPVDSLSLSTDTRYWSSNWCMVRYAHSRSSDPPWLCFLRSTCERKNVC